MNPWTTTSNSQSWISTSTCLPGSSGFRSTSLLATGTWRDLSSASLEKLRSTLKQRRAQKQDDYVPRKTPYHHRAATKAKRQATREPEVVPRTIPPDNRHLMPF